MNAQKTFLATSVIVCSLALMQKTEAQTDNTGYGTGAVNPTTTGSYLAGFGSYALTSDTTGGYNSAFGALALYSDTTGYGNTAVGDAALYNNGSGAANIGIGREALHSNATGEANVASGYLVMSMNTSGSENCAYGHASLLYNTTGSNNIGIGTFSLEGNGTGSTNIAIGYEAGINLTSGDNNIDIGNYGVSGESSIMRLGSLQTNTYLAGVYGVTVASGADVVVNSDGKLGTVTSSRRFKDNIRNMGNSSDVIYSLHPVAFEYKHALDPQDTPQFGLVAEDVAKVDPSLVVRDKSGAPYTVRYGAVNAMLLNEFLKEHQKVESLEEQVQSLQKAVQDLKK